MVPCSGKGTLVYGLLCTVATNNAKTPERYFRKQGGRDLGISKTKDTNVQRAAITRSHLIHLYYENIDRSSFDLFTARTTMIQ